MSAREAGQDFAVRGAFTARGEVSLTGQLLVTLSTGTRVDDLDVSGASCVICDTSVQTEITGFASGAKRNVLCVANRQSSTANVILSARDTNSGSDNRIITDVDVIIAPGYGATFVWSELLMGGGGWRCVGEYRAPQDIPVQSIASADGSIAVANTSGAFDVSARLIARLATAAGLPSSTYSNGSSGVGATITASANGALIVDGTTVALGDYVLVKNELSASRCGLFQCSDAGSVSTPWVLTRAARMDSAGKYVGAVVTVLAGSTNALHAFICTNTSPPTVGLSSIAFTTAAQPNIQIQDEGVNKGSPGQATTYNFVGDGINASVSGSTATVTVNRPTILETFDPRTQFFFYDDFVLPVSSNQYTTSGFGFGTSTTRPGLLVRSSTSGVMSFNTVACFYPANGSMSVKGAFILPTLSNSTNRYGIGFGFRAVFNGASSYSVYGYYSDNFNSGNFTLIHTNSGTDTNYFSSVAAVANTWTDYEIRIAAGGTSSELYINGVLAVTGGTVPSSLMAAGFVLAVTSGSVVGNNIATDYIYVGGAR